MRNAAAMETSHVEVMNTLVKLCEPDPHGGVPFDPIRDKLISLYGAAVDHPDFLYAYKLVVDAGGHTNPHMRDLQDFTKVWVNPKHRKMRFEIYAVVAAYPVDCPKIKNACIKFEDS